MQLRSMKCCLSFGGRFFSRLTKGQTFRNIRHPSSITRRYKLHFVRGFSASSESRSGTGTGSEVTSPYFQVNHAPISKEAEYRDTNKERPFPIYRVLDIDGNLLDNNYTLPMSESQLIEMYTNMVKTEIFDFIHYRIHRVGKTSFYMPNNGEEAAQVGSSAAWQGQDVLFFQYRELGTFFQRGYTVQQASDTNFSNEHGHGLGRQMPVHYGDVSLNCVTVSSTLATQMPHASGAGYGIKRMNQKQLSLDKKGVVVCYFGDGAASEGDAHAAFNFSATTESPVLWFCRNNGYAISTPTSDQYRGDGIAARAYAYGMIGVRFDGNDLLATYQVSKDSRLKAIEQSRPIMMEAMTYRGSHHSTSDDASAYRDAQEQEEWTVRQNPIRRVKLFMEKQGMWDENKNKQLREELENEINQAWQESESLKKPHWHNLFTDVYDELHPRLKKQMNMMDKHLEIYGNQDAYRLDQYAK